MCRLCTDNDFRIGLKQRTGTPAYFSTTLSGNTVICPCGRTITWQSFRSTVAKLTSLPVNGCTEISKPLRSQLNERGIWLATRSKNSPTLPTIALEAAKNLSSGSPAGDLPSVLPLHLRLLIDIARQKGKELWPNGATSKDVSELHEKCIRSLRSYSQPSGRTLESHCAILTDSIIRDIKNGTEYRRRQNGNPK